MRSRWHIEISAFHQWGSYWNLEHAYRHTSGALHALFLIWMLAFNLLQLFFYYRLGREHSKPVRPRDVSDTFATCSTSCSATWPPCRLPSPGESRSRIVAEIPSERATRGAVARAPIPHL